MLQARSVSYKAGNTYLINDVSVDFEPGKLHLIIGPNGAGKSTLIKLLSGQLKCHSGDVLYGDKPVGSFTTGQLARMRAALSQSLELSFPMKAWEVVMMGRYPHFTGKPGAQDIKACEQAISLFNLDELAERDYTTLSGGEKQRVHFARVLSQIWYPVAGQCRYLLLDEPLTFLDIHYQYQFMEQVKTLLQSGDLVVIGVVHDLNLASKFADRITLLLHGKILASGTVNETLTAANIKMAYEIDPDIVTIANRKYIVY